MRNMHTNRRSPGPITSAATQRRLKPEPEPTVKKFIKIILLSRIIEKMMKVPARFVRFGPKLTDNVTLQTPVGFKRSIRIKRIGDEVWFEKGWSEFAEAHSLSDGHFLFFHYEGDSCFRVVIFDVSASEIEYPLDDTDDNREEVMDDDEQGFTGFESSDDDGEVVDMDELLKKKKKKPRVNIKSENVIILD
ncbi:AP2/B3-like transcriptional factor family protein [Arabidopsis thaliana]|uniref:B3 domain-containing protein At1g49475 n=1 Tax=Arabidopsis thaliana TaxID=3702 RepID=Y1475_ARATH|nr:AP2/B3-like transcriptional factor family protein [Arabidopsis thaliana]Q9XIB4.2 RecName: Full=B3 domain-containing protein At1g49475 [Arabidopsis thaliana]AEE32433.1 AP2/B3-like transcriptional factor family protein [Arabidopsis thaliana]|eukprot:NP_683415.2 AP2/B3-like transcriptional factor family protein [Arabidopsis thaliana]